MRPKIILPLALVAALFVAAACHRDDPEPTKTPLLVAVSMSETTVVIPSQGSVEVSFSVADPDYVFNFFVDEADCQVRLVAKDGKAPSEFRLSRIVAERGKGIYMATLTDLGVEEDYSREVRLMIKTGNDTFTPSEYFTVRSEGAGYGILVKTGLPTVYIDTENGKAVNSKTQFVKATAKIKGTGQYEGLAETACEIRGRGNTTWYWPKKPYLVKLEEKQHIFGMHKHTIRRSS